MRVLKVLDMLLLFVGTFEIASFLLALAADFGVAEVLNKCYLFACVANMFLSGVVLCWVGWNIYHGAWTGDVLLLKRSVVVGLVGLFGIPLSFVVGIFWELLGVNKIGPVNILWLILLVPLVVEIIMLMLPLSSLRKK